MKLVVSKNDLEGQIWLAEKLKLGEKMVKFETN